MKWATWLVATLGVLLAPSAAAAQSERENEVKAAVHRIYAALNASNPDAVVGQMATGGYTDTPLGPHAGTTKSAGPSS